MTSPGPWWVREGLWPWMGLGPAGPRCLSSPPAALSTRPCGGCEAARSLWALVPDCSQPRPEREEKASCQGCSWARWGRQVALGDTPISPAG